MAGDAGPELEAAAVDDAERPRDLMHTAEYDKRMDARQAQPSAQPASEVDKIRGLMAAATENPGRPVTR